jgi:hypothetical protein
VLYFIMAMLPFYIQEKILPYHMSIKRHKNLTPINTGGYFIVDMEQCSYHNNLQ